MHFPVVILSAKKYFPATGIRLSKKDIHRFRQQLLPVAAGALAIEPVFFQADGIGNIRHQVINIRLLGRCMGYD